MNRDEALKEGGPNPSSVFLRFLNNYFGSPMILMRDEEDTSVWDELTGREREIAIEMVLANFDSEHTAFARAAGMIRDERALPLLKARVEHGRFAYDRLYAAKVLYDWNGFDRYLPLFWELLPELGEYSKSSAGYWISGIPQDEALKVLFALFDDESSFVRWSAYGALKAYFGRPISPLGDEAYYEEANYFTADEVFADRQLFNARLEELRAMVATLGKS